MSGRISAAWFRARTPLVVLVTMALLAAGFSAGRRVGGAGAGEAVFVALSPREGILACAGDHEPGTAPYLTARRRCASRPGAVVAAVVLPGGPDGPLLLHPSSWPTTVDGRAVPAVFNAVAAPDPDRSTHGAAYAIADLDNDGTSEVIAAPASESAQLRSFTWMFEDAVYVTYRGGHESAPYRNLTDQVREATSVSAADWNRDGWADFAVSSAVDRPSPGAESLRLYQNRGFTHPGSFDDVAATSGAQRQLDRLLGTGLVPAEGPLPLEQAMIVDLDADTNDDIVVLTRFGVLAVLWGDAEQRFDTSTVLEIPAGARAFATGDLDRDGRLDLAVAAALPYPNVAGFCPRARPCDTSGAGSVLLRGGTDRTFAAFDDPRLAVLGEVSATSVVIADLDNDAWPEVAFGLETPGAERGGIQPAGDPSAHHLVIFEPTRRNEVWTGFAVVDDPAVALPPITAMTAADVDSDGDLDLVLTSSLDGGVYIRKSVTHASSVTVSLTGAATFTATGSTRDGLGAVVELKTTAGTLRAQVGPSASGRFSAAPPRVLFGLGGATPLKLTVTWPSGRMSTTTTFGPDGLVEVTEPAE